MATASIPKIRNAIKLAQDMGLPVVGFEVLADGGFRIMTATEKLDQADAAPDSWIRSPVVSAKIKGVNTTRKRLADGTTRIYYYHRDTGAPLPGQPVDAAFMAAFTRLKRSSPRTWATSTR